MNTLASLFFQPFLTGLLFSIALPLLGAYLRLRDEWLAALAFAQISAFGALFALLFGAPPLLGGVGSAALAAWFKQAFETASRKTQGTAYALLFLLGWSSSILLAANLPVAEHSGHALFDGQLYFTGRAHLILAGVLLIAVGIFLRLLSKTLLLSSLFPDFFRARGSSARRARAVFDLAVAVALALSATSVGVIVAFAQIFIPPLIAFKWGGHWKASLVIAASVGAAAHTAAFILALRLDQPYGPLLGLVLLAMAGAALSIRRAG